jgi:hypothetical protein
MGLLAARNGVRSSGLICLLRPGHRALLLWVGVVLLSIISVYALKTADNLSGSKVATRDTACSPRFTPPPKPVILFNLADPPARIFASRLSLRMRACSAALDGGVLASEDAMGVVSAILRPEIFARSPIEW